MKTLTELREENALLQMQLDAVQKENIELIARRKLEQANAQLRERIQMLRAEAMADANRGKDPEQ